MDNTPVDRLYEESKAAVVSLELNEPSLASAASDNFRKALLLASASHFESVLTTTVVEYVHEVSSGSARLVSFAKNKAISRQYHSWFDWDATNANKFFALFGAEFKGLMNQKVTASETLKHSISAFMEIGRERNKLIHQDYATFALEKTLDEVHLLYQKAANFVNCLPAFLRENYPSPAIESAVAGAAQQSVAVDE